MKAAELLESRRRNWSELEELCLQIGGRRPVAAKVARFAALYRAACADLALADAYQLPPNTVDYLHRLVARAHAQLHRSQRFDLAAWSDMLLVEVPRRIFQDACVQLAFVLFWGAFLLAAFLAYSDVAWPTFADDLMGRAHMEMLTEMYKDPIGNSNHPSAVMSGFYIRHNTGIGLNCFASGLLVVPGLFTTLFNGCFLGASFGYMARAEVGEARSHFFEFVTAHGPFELTAICLSAGAGLRLGMSWIHTRGMTRLASLTTTARETMPLMGAAMILFVLAAFLEGFVSPSPLPYALKAAVAIVSSGMLLFYFVVLGFPRNR